MTRNQTSNITTQFAIVHYGWANPYPTSSDDPTTSSLDARLLGGVHFVQFSRNKSAIGGTLEIDIFGENPKVNVGDWIVVRTSSKKKFTSNFRNEGLVRFIGQIYSMTPQFFVDGDGNLRRTYKLSVREWSHVLYVPVRLDHLTIEANDKTFTSEAGAINVATGEQTNKTAQHQMLTDVLESKLNVYDLVKTLLKVIGGLSASTSIQGGDLNVYKVSTRMPWIPKKLVEDSVITEYNADGSVNKFDIKQPWSTGFMWNIIGTQHWDSTPKDGLFNGEAGISESLTLITGQRPANVTDPSLYWKGYSFHDLLANKLNNEGYEHYTDMWYVKDTASDTIKAAPVLVVRDIPYSMRGLEQDDEEFTWTYYDDLPRVVIPLVNVVNIVPTQSFLEAKNYIRVNYQPNILKDYTTQGLAIENARTNVPSQFRYGGMEFTPTINDIYRSKNREGLESQAGNWLGIMSTKLIDYHSNAHLFPRCSILIKDNDFPVSVGSNIEIPLGAGLAKLVGHVESIDFRYTVHPDGKQANETYIKVSRLCMLATDDKTFVPLPAGGILDLLNIKEYQNAKEYWLSYKTKKSKPKSLATDIDFFKLK